MSPPLPTKTDFHLHTTASDGKASPCDLLRIAQKEHLGMISITDHDTIAGSQEALQNSHLFDGPIIPGVEINVTHNIIVDKVGHSVGMSLSDPSYARGVMKG